MTTAERRQDREIAYADRVDGLMAILSVLFLVVFTAIVVWQDMPRGLRIACAVIQVIIWLVFVADLCIRVALAEKKLRWLLTHPIDVLAVLWPAFRPLKILAVIGDRRFRAERQVTRTTQAVLVAAVLLIWVCSVAVLAAERGQPESSIETIGDAVWWAFVTIATVGYGDMVPVTPAGRGIGIVLMVVGLALVAIITASVASWFVSNTRGDADRADASRDRDQHDRIVELERKLDVLLKAQIEREKDGPTRG